ncbi:unnamed protein product, partial [Dicrocoelium dendriticum]
MLVTVVFRGIQSQCFCGITLGDIIASSYPVREETRVVELHRSTAGPWLLAGMGNAALVRPNARFQHIDLAIRVQFKFIDRTQGINTSSFWDFVWTAIPVTFR